jgi:hypothetical protein
MRDRGRLNMTWKESVKRDLKDWCVIKELALDRREWKLAIHMPEPWSSVPSLLLPFCQVFFRPFSLFWLSVLLSFLLSRFVFFCRPLFFMPLLFHSYFIPIFLAHVVSSLAYLICLGIKWLVVVFSQPMWFPHEFGVYKRNIWLVVRSVCMCNWNAAFQMILKVCLLLMFHLYRKKGRR